MKKIIAIFILCTILTAIFAGCADTPAGEIKDPSGDQVQSPDGDENKEPGGQTGFEDLVIPEGLSGADIAKLLLANERLNSQLLKTEGDIFEDGEQVFRNLASTARDNLAMSAAKLSVTPMTYRTLTPVPTADITKYGDGTVEIDGNFYRWSDFKENNNSYEAFAHTTEGIVTSAETAAELIDNIKKNVRVVDKWVKMYDTKFYLHVDENSEVLIQYNETETDVSKDICKRYKNESGKDVYELYQEYLCDEYDFFTRITYIPGERYEFSVRQDLRSEVYENCFIADHSKGYWETYTIGAFPTHYNVSCFVMKDDIAYDSFYDPKTQKINYLKVMSVDRETDILHIMGDINDNIVFVELIFAGFDGVANIEVEAAQEEVFSGDGFENLDREEAEKYKVMATYDEYHLMNNEYGVVNMTNGKQIRYGDMFMDSKVQVTAIHARAVGEYVHGSVGLNIRAESYDDIIACIKSFIEDMGLVCRRDSKAVFDGITRAYNELEGFTDYYKWNGIIVDTEDKIAKAFDVERERFSAMKALYEAVKDAEVIDFENKEQLELNAVFSDVVIDGMSGIKAEGSKIKIEKVTLTVKDTFLFVKDEPYSVAFALLRTDGAGGLIHLGSAEKGVKFEADAITVDGGAEVEIPHLAVGEYKLVAYVATSDGIRSTKYADLKGDSADGTVVKYGNMDIVASIGTDKSLIVSSAENIDVTTEIHGTKGIGYAELKELVNVESYVYGTAVDELIEILDAESGEYSAFTGEETEIAEGSYRAKYEKKTDDGYSYGYIYFELLLDIPAEPSENPDNTEEIPDNPEISENPEDQVMRT